MFMLKWILEECRDAAAHLADSVPKEITDAYKAWVSATESLYQQVTKGK